jgi:putative lipoprotein
MRRALAVPIALCCLAAMGCRSTVGSAPVSGTITGSVTYRERMALPPDAELVVELVRLARPGGPALKLAGITIKGGIRVPQAFTLTYSTADIDAGDDYMVRAHIAVDDEVLFATTTAHAVITKGYPSHVDLMLRRNR